ncbi:uncharacterized protein LOC126574587 [Anopheles aquasalis]|uniref:uncharacterized protein LOC126574587 n=1 Tax=Anopheles aquasalis TaxID=42839 RepID=UPI00215A58BD|nr:uncharacterized protein LOC126574587 [Anopheles aquasalis]
MYARVYGCAWDCEWEDGVDVHAQAFSFYCGHVIALGNHHRHHEVEEQEEVEACGVVAAAGYAGWGCCRGERALTRVPQSTGGDGLQELLQLRFRIAFSEREREQIAHNRNSAALSMEVVDGDGEVCFEEAYVVRSASDQSWSSMFGMLSTISNRIAEMRSKIKAIDSRLSTCEEQQVESTAIVGGEVDELATQMSALNRAIGNLQFDAIAAPITAFITPATCKEDLDDLESKAKDKQFVNLVAHTFAREFGYNRQGEGAQIFQQVMRYFFDKDFLMACTWSGIHRDTIKYLPQGTIPSTPIFIYSSLRELIHACVTISDETFTQAECVAMIRTCLRSSRMKLKRLCTRTNKKAKENIPSDEVAVKGLVENQLRRLRSAAETDT